jgi:hypothetical protein
MPESTSSLSRGRGRLRKVIRRAGIGLLGTVCLCIVLGYLANSIIVARARAAAARIEGPFVIAVDQYAHARFRTTVSQTSGTGKRLQQWLRTHAGRGSQFLPRPPHGPYTIVGKDMSLDLYPDGSVHSSLPFWTHMNQGFVQQLSADAERELRETILEAIREHSAAPSKPDGE